MLVLSEKQAHLYHNLLLLKVFTIPELVEITGIDYQDVYAEVRGLEKSKLVVRRGTRKKADSSAKGRPPILFEIRNRSRWFGILHSIRDFYEKQLGPAPPPPEQPESNHYYIAAELLGKAKLLGGEWSAEERERRLDLIMKRLQYARQEEGIAGEADSVDPYIRKVAACIDALEEEAMDFLA